MLQHSGGIIKWTQAKLHKLDVITQKAHRFCMNSDVDFLYIQRKNGGRGLISAAFTIESEINNLSLYVHHSEDPCVKLIAGHSLVLS